MTCMLHLTFISCISFTVLVEKCFCFSFFFLIVDCTTRWTSDKKQISIMPGMQIPVNFSVRNKRYHLIVGLFFSQVIWQASDTRLGRILITFSSWTDLLIWIKLASPNCPSILSSEFPNCPSILRKLTA